MHEYTKDMLALVFCGLVLFAFWALPLVIRQLLKEADEFREAKDELLAGAVALVIFLAGALVASVFLLATLFW